MIFIHSFNKDMMKNQFIFCCDENEKIYIKTIEDAVKFLRIVKINQFKYFKEFSHHVDFDFNSKLKNIW